MSSSTETLRVRIAKITHEATDVCSFELVHADGAHLPPFSAGSHIDVHLGAGLIRQYSLCNDPAETHRYLVAVLRDPKSRGGSIGMHALKEDDTLTISVPKNHFPLAPEAAHSLLLAGGIGVTPILCMAERLSATASNFAMHYCARSRERSAFLDRIEAAAFGPKVHCHFDNGDAAQKLEIATLLAAQPAATHLYVCGPKGFMDAVLATARSTGWPEAQLHYEFFSAEPTKSDSDGSFEVKIASSGRVITVPKDKTVVEALAEAGIEVPTSCEQGVCGTCITKVLEGTPDHRDMYLTPAEQAANTQFMPCCSRAKTPMLVLDL
jgi:vanillate monooxygenase ferredoxin subunit